MEKTEEAMKTTTIEEYNNDDNEKININEMEEQYLNLNKDDVMWADWQDDDLQLRIRKLLSTDLNVIERRVLLLYAELGSLRKVAKVLNVSPTTVYYKLRDVREKILTLLKLNEQ